jgi:hypothetical protein
MQFYNVRGLCLASIVAFLFVAKSQAEDVNLKELYKLNPSIQSIKQVCPWRSSTAKGTIRLMQVEEKGAHKLYVQWLRQGIAGMPQAPISTIGINEINDDSYFRFDLPDGRLMAGACSIETIMEDIVDERRFRLTLYLTGPGKYEVHMTRLLDAALQ